jgi:MscS family membrane protein
MRSAFLALALVFSVAAVNVHGRATEPPRSGPGPRAAAEGGQRPAPRAKGAPSDELGRSVPRAAVEGFLTAVRAGDHERAARYLDLTPLPPAARERRAPVLASQLGEVLERTLWIDLEELSDAPEGMTDDDLPARRDRVGTIETARGPVDVLVARVPRGDGDATPVWKFAPATVARIPALHAEVTRRSLAERLPAPLVELTLLGVPLWQWLALVVLLLLASGAGWLAASVVARVIARREAGTDRPRARVTGPLRLVVAVLVFSAGEAALGLPPRMHSLLNDLALLLTVLALAWGAFRLVDLVTSVLRQRLLQRGENSAIALLPAGRSLLKVIVLALAVLMALDNLGFDVTALVAGLGIGGIALALAAQKSVENLFGGVTLYTDQPVRVGDFCRFGDRVGTVEAIGLRSTRVRTLERTLVTVPNAEFANLQLENYSRRDKIWYHPTIGLRYETTPDQIRVILVAIREMLYAHPRVDPEPARIRFVRFGAYSLDLEVFAYVTATDFGEFLEIAEDLNLRIMDIVSRAGSSFAFPSHTTYVESGSGLDADAARRAEAQVRDWRQEGTLYLPGFPPERIDALRSTLDYPPAGSPRRDSRASGGPGRR